MGVMRCSKKDCENILCDTYVKSIGYICDECISEFKSYLQKNALNPTTEGQITKELEKFINIPKSEYIHDREITVDSFFNECTR